MWRHPRSSTQTHLPPWVAPFLDMLPCLLWMPGLEGGLKGPEVPEVGGVSADVPSVDVDVSSESLHRRRLQQRFVDFLLRQAYGAPHAVIRSRALQAKFAGTSDKRVHIRSTASHYLPPFAYSPLVLQAALMCRQWIWEDSRPPAYRLRKETSLVTCPHLT